MLHNSTLYHAHLGAILTNPHSLLASIGGHFMHHKLRKRWPNLLFLFQVAFGRVTRDAPADTANVDELFNNLKTQFNEAATKVNEALGIKNSDDVLNNVKATANDIATNVNTLLNKVSEEAKKHEPEVKKAVEDFQNNVRQVTDKLKKENPEAFNSAQKIQQNLEQTINKVLEESKKLEKQLKDDTSGIRTDVTKFTKEMVDNAIAGAKNLQAKLAEQGKKA